MNRNNKLIPRGYSTILVGDPGSSELRKIFNVFVLFNFRVFVISLFCHKIHKFYG